MHFVNHMFLKDTLFLVAGAVMVGAMRRRSTSSAVSAAGCRSPSPYS